MSSLIFWECKTQTLPVSKRLHSVLDKLEVSVEDSLSLPSKLLKLTPTRDPEKSPRKKLTQSVTSSPDHPSTTYQSGSSIDKKIQELEPGPTLFPINLIPWWEKISRDSERPRTIEVSDIFGEQRSEVKEPSLPVDAVRLSVLPERSEHVCVVVLMDHWLQVNHRLA